ncbi:tonB complex domain protein, partial [Yersinia pestis PY-72]
MQGRVMKGVMVL